jgi:predicted TIM-barrel fold metal-dependent hydrolase
VNELPKVDAHHHIWDLDRNYYPWLRDGPPVQRVYGDSAPLRRNYLLADYLRDAADQNIVKSVYLQCGYDPSDPVGETRYVQEVADADPRGFPHAIVAHADLEAGNVADVLKAHCRHRNMRGVRTLLNWHDTMPQYRWAKRPDYTTDPAWRRGYALLGEMGLSFDCQLYSHQLPLAVELAKSFRNVPMIINHTGMPIERERGGLQLWKDGLAELAQLPHVAIKISGLGMVDHRWTVDSIRPLVRYTIETFGTDRCMFASNFPVDSLKSDFNTLYNAFKTIVADHPVAEQRKLFHDNAVRIYRL